VSVQQNMFFSFLFSYPLPITIPVHSTVIAYKVRNRFCQPVSLHIFRPQLYITHATTQFI